MVLTADNARDVLRVMEQYLREIDARDVLDGIDETRRIGVEESLTEVKGSELTQVARTRRRPLTDQETLQVVLERLHQRLIVLPRLASSVRTRLGSEDVEWRVDTEFSSADRFVGTTLKTFLPTGVEEVTVLLNELHEVITSARGVI